MIQVMEEREILTRTTLILTQRQLCDLELILNRGFAPLTSFMNKADYENVLTEMRLSNGHFWPMPITLDVDQDFLMQIEKNAEIALLDPEGLLLAVMQVKESWPVDKRKEAQAIFGTEELAHPGVAYLQHHTKSFYISGTLMGIALPPHYDFTHLRHTPATLREWFEQHHWKRVVAFQTRNPMHRAHQELTKRAASVAGANILIHPVVGMTKPGDIDYYTRVKCYEHVLKTYQPQTALLSLLPLAMRMAGPREALWHALIRKNYGCTHFIVGRDHAGPGNNSQGLPFYPPYLAQELATQYQEEMGIEIIPFQEMVYSQKQSRYFPLNEFPKEEEPAQVSGTALRQCLQKREAIPSWFSYPEVIAELRKSFPLPHEVGVTIFLTGLPSSGKSTLAQGLALKLRELADKTVTLLDGDIIRTHLSKGLGFSEEDRARNVTRVGFVAKEITRHKGWVICALVSPFAKARNEVREMVTEVGGFVEVYVSTPLSTCEARDRKGLYKKARAGLVQQFTGISDPYEAPLTPEINIDTTHLTHQEAIDVLIQKIKKLGYLV